MLEYDMAIDNVVGHVTLKLKDKLNLKKIMDEEDEDVDYEPEQFPGLFFTIHENGKPIKFTVYSSGKIITYGSKSVEEFERRAKLICSILEKYIEE